MLIRQSSTAQEKVPFSLTSAHGSGASCCDNGTREFLEVLWSVVGSTMEELAQMLQQLETQVGQQQQDQLMHQQTTIDADRAARTPFTQLPRMPEETWLISELETSQRRSRVKRMSGKVGHSKCDQYISAVDEELYVELVDVEANPLRELPLAGMNEPQKKPARQLAFMLTMHTKDRALQMITKLRDPANGFEIWRRFLEEWEPAYRGG